MWSSRSNDCIGKKLTVTKLHWLCVCAILTCKNVDIFWQNMTWKYRISKDILACSITFVLYIYIYHHHHVVPLARISLTFSRHFSLSFIASGRSSGLHPVSSHSCWMYVRAGRPAFAQPYVGVHRSTSLMSLSLLLQQCPACLVKTATSWIRGNPSS